MIVLAALLVGFALGVLVLSGLGYGLALHEVNRLHR